MSASDGCFPGPITTNESVVRSLHPCRIAFVRPWSLGAKGRKKEGHGRVISLWDTTMHFPEDPAPTWKGLEACL